MVELENFPRGGKPLITRAIHNNVKFGKKRKLTKIDDVKEHVSIMKKD